MSATNMKEEFLQSISDTFSEGFDVIKKKNMDYSGDINPYSQFENVARIVGISPEQVILVFIVSKACRMANLLRRNPEVVEESLTDTLGDSINYNAILKAYRERAGRF